MVVTKRIEGGLQVVQVVFLFEHGAVLLGLPPKDINGTGVQKISIHTSLPWKCYMLAVLGQDSGILFTTLSFSIFLFYF